MNLDAILVSINAKQVSEMSDPMRVDQTVANARRGLEKCISLGNWWAALHFLLCGEVPIPKSDAIRCGATWFENSLENLLMGGADLPTVKFTGTVRIHNPETVAVLDRIIAKRDLKMIAKQLDLDDMDAEGIPLPENLTEDGTLNILNRLKEFFDCAAANGDAVLVVIG